jgi:DNA polymerase/3'-5' exonuclease PolX
MKYEKILPIAERLQDDLKPHCHRIAIAGSIRRKKADCKDIEIVAIPKAFDTGIFASGVAAILGRYKVIKGHFPCKYTQRELPQGINLDFFTATPNNWGLILAIRTGPAEYSHEALATRWRKLGYFSTNGLLYGKSGPKYLPEEKDLYDLLQLPYVQPEDRFRPPKG